jgi:hypothetical protein
MVKLVPFSGSLPIELSGEVSLTGTGIRATFTLEDPEGAVVDSLQEGEWGPGTLRRAGALWESTCFELFWALPGHDDYYELNVSPKGEWNLYHFDRYREPQPPAESSDYRLTSVKSTPKEITFELHSDNLPSAIEASLCAVIKTATGISYYSHAHLGAHEDFHIRESLSLKRHTQD